MTTESPEKGDPAPVVERLARIAEVLQIRGSFERFPVPHQDQFQAQVGPPKVRWNFDEESGLAVFVDQSFESSVQSGAESPTPESGSSESGKHTLQSDLIARVSATFLLIFEFTDGPRLRESDLAAFAKANGVFSATPYWREFLNNSLARAGLPPFMLPVMRMKKRPIEGKRSET